MARKQRRVAGTAKTSQKARPPIPVIAPSPVVPADDSSDKGIPAGTSSEAPAAFPIVGIGASAGGLSAFEAFFSGMPANSEPGMAFVLVQHLAPDHKSLLSELIRRYTRMQVFEVEDGMVVQANCAYIIPPNRDMAFLNGALQLLEPAEPRGQRLPIDFFFRSLAQDQGDRAIGIVLSGTGSDGTLGVRAIKGGGGMVMAQTPESTEFDGMPRSALATGLVDYELTPAEMPTQLLAYSKRAFGYARPRATVDAPIQGGALKKIFVLLRAQTGHDFSRYKPSTINRRIERRMALHQIDSVGGYVQYLQQAPLEVEGLFRDLLIGVTSFFRDPEVFKALEEQVIPRLLDHQPPSALVRVWSAGCSTGEEAYSIAILLQERMQALKQGCVVQLFATDIDSRAVATARAGVYPASVAADLTSDRLARFFTAESDGSIYRVKKIIRDMLVFSEHDVNKDPPFSKLDLIVCRNLLIYLGLELQKTLIPLFHYALKPGGFLFLGTSEGIGDFGELFTVVDRKSKLYQRTGHFRDAERDGPTRFPAPTPGLDAASPRYPKRPASPPKPLLREVAEQALLRQIAPASLLVNREGDILYQHGRTGMYLEPAPGESGVSNILKMAREGLRRDLSQALHKSANSRELVRCPGLRVKTNGHFTFVNLTVCPVSAGTAGTPESPGSESEMYLVILDEAPAAGAEAAPQPAERADAAGLPSAGHSDAEATLAALREDLRARDEYLHSAHEELESSNEELKSSNEEMQSVNEELQSTNEELETSKEELQSVNEEIGTVNTELQTKVADLSRANNDMSNLLAGTGIGTVFVDFDLRIVRFTPAAREFLNLIPGDVGRPVAHMASNLVGYDRLVADLQSVLGTLIPKEMNVQTTVGKWTTIRMLPYRTLDNVIEGAVITFVDITEAVKTRDALDKANELARLAVVVRDAHDAITVQGLDGRILAWNPGAMRMYGWSEAEALLMNVRDRIPPELRAKALATLEQLSRAETIEPYRTERLTKQGMVMAVSIVSTALLNEAGEVYAIATTERGLGGDKR